MGGGGERKYRKHCATAVDSKVDGINSEKNNNQGLQSNMKDQSVTNIILSTVPHIARLYTYKEPPTAKAIAGNRVFILIEQKTY